MVDVVAGEVDVVEEVGVLEDVSPEPLEVSGSVVTGRVEVKVSVIVLLLPLDSAVVVVDEVVIIVVEPEPLMSTVVDGLELEAVVVIMPLLSSEVEETVVVPASGVDEDIVTVVPLPAPEPEDVEVDRVVVEPDDSVVVMVAEPVVDVGGAVVVLPSPLPSGAVVVVVLSVVVTGAAVVVAVAVVVVVRSAVEVVGMVVVVVGGKASAIISASESSRCSSRTLSRRPVK